MQSAIRFKHYADIPEQILSQARQLTTASPFRLRYHIECETGYLNDPNGFSYFNGQFHLCYQWSPLRYCDGYWYQGWFHLVSDDLVNWRAIGPLIEPETPYDSHGPYSGSALATCDALMIFYTGNTRDAQWRRTPYQLIARLDAQGNFSRQLPPAVIGSPPGYTDHFRDPKIWRDGDEYYAVIGAQRESLEGTCLLMHSAEGRQWEVKGEIKTRIARRGYMWECPDYFELNQQGVLVYCPQGLNEGDGQSNLYTVCYLTGEPLSLLDLTFEHHSPRLLDQGFDFYAPQTMQSTDGRRIMTGWMGVPEMHYPTERYGHCGALTLPRELYLRDGILCQRPVAELMALRDKHQYENFSLNNAQRKTFHSGAVFEARLVISTAIQEQITLSLRADISGAKKSMLTLDARNGEIIFDRTHSGAPLNLEYGSRRVTPWKFTEMTIIHIFSDTTSLEIFINDGAFVSTSRIFPHSHQDWLIVENHGEEIAMEFNCWQLKGMHDDGKK